MSMNINNLTWSNLKIYGDSLSLLLIWFIYSSFLLDQSCKGLLILLFFLKNQLLAFYAVYLFSIPMIYATYLCIYSFYLSLFVLHFSCSILRRRTRNFIFLTKILKTTVFLFGTCLSAFHRFFLCSVFLISFVLKYFKFFLLYCDYRLYCLIFNYLRITRYILFILIKIV